MEQSPDRYKQACRLVPPHTSASLEVVLPRALAHAKPISTKPLSLQADLDLIWRRDRSPAASLAGVAPKRLVPFWDQLHHHRQRQ
eukprot:6186980-Pleurochrysis_carterae.AAC.2